MGAGRPLGSKSLPHLGLVDRKPAVIKPSLNGTTFGNGMVKDPATGFLTHSPNVRGPKSLVFDASRKVQLLKLAKDMYPNMAAVCEMVGISTATFRNHLAIDEGFRAAFDLIKEATIDGVEASMFTFSKRPQNFMDRIAIMRAYRGELYNPKSVVTYKHEISKEESESKRIGLAGAIDAELVEVSTRVLSAEVVEVETGENSLQVPGSASAGSTQTPVDDARDGNSFQGEETASGTRDPLLDM